jgi:hypothetical protein
MKKRSTRTRIVAVAVSMGALGLAGTAPAGEEMPGDRSVPFWPHETGALMGTSETFVDVRGDGSYYDPSIGRRVAAVVQG